MASFHTLGKVKNYSLARGSRPSPERLAAEQAVIAEADRVLAPTPTEAAQLVGLYRADPSSVRLVPPGVDHLLFVPGDRARAREHLHLSGLRLALYVGRLQPHKGPDVAVRTLAEAVARDPRTPATSCSRSSVDRAARTRERRSRGSWSSLRRSA